MTTNCPRCGRPAEPSGVFRLRNRRPTRARFRCACGSRWTRNLSAADSVGWLAAHSTVDVLGRARP